jgi:alkylation response protein AidB-like acyl-CoA dehydrogenase
VDLRPSPAEQLLVATAREVLRQHWPIETAQRLARDPRGSDGALWRRMAELGWPGLLIAPALGGSGGSLLDVALLVEEMGYACLAGPFVASAVVATTAIEAAASEAQRKRWLPALASGERVATLALGADGSPAPEAAALRGAVPGRLTGRTRFVREAHVADDLVVAVRAAGASRLLVLPLDRPGVRRVPMDALGGDRLFEVALDGVAVEPDDLLDGAADAALDAALRAGAVARTAEMVGAAQRVLELAVEHARTRVQGGKPIGGHQAIQHACADMVRDVDASRALVRTAAWRAASGLPAEAEVAMAKAWGGEACLAVARRAHQVLGALGYCEEHPLPLFHARILAAAHDAGDAAHHLEVTARALGLA